MCNSLKYIHIIYFLSKIMEDIDIQVKMKVNDLYKSHIR